MYSDLLKTIVVVSSLLLSSGCVSTIFSKKEPIPVEIKTVEVPLEIQHPTLPRAIKLKDPFFYVVSDKNREEFNERILKESNGVFVALTISDYELMSYNMQEIKRYINDLKEVVIYYKKVTTKDKPDEEKPD